MLRLPVSPENREQVTNIGSVRCITQQRCDSNHDGDTPNGRGALKTAPALVIREQLPKGAHNDLLGYATPPVRCGVEPATFEKNKVNPHEVVPCPELI